MKADEVRGNPIKNLLASEKHFSEFTDWLTNASSRIGPFEAERDSRKTEITFRKKDGWFEGEMSCKIIRLDIPILVLIVVRDVTERIRRNEE
jgi:PAS domain S-box-containing protein